MKTLSDIGWKTILPDVILRTSIPHTPTQRNHDAPTPRHHDTSTPRYSDTKNDKEFLLVFDDGYESIYRNAYPVLQDLGYLAVIFIPSAYIGKSNDWDHQMLGRRSEHLNENMIRELARAGWIFGSHSVTHPDLTRLTEKQLDIELGDSRRRLQDLTGQEVNWISFPFGLYNQRVIDKVLQLGYRGAVSPVRLGRVVIPEQFKLVILDAVYLWNSSRSVENLISIRHGYGGKRFVRKFVNRLNRGTVIWKRILGA